MLAGRARGAGRSRVHASRHARGRGEPISIVSGMHQSRDAAVADEFNCDHGQALFDQSPISSSNGTSRDAPPGGGLAASRLRCCRLSSAGRRCDTVTSQARLRLTLRACAPMSTTPGFPTTISVDHLGVDMRWCPRVELHASTGGINKCPVRLSLPPSTMARSPA